MSLLQQHRQPVEDALRAAYHEQEQKELEVSSRWKTDLMQDVRRLGPLNAKDALWAFSNHYVWRFATVACVFVLMLSVYVGVNGFDTTTAIADLFLEDPVEFMLVQSIGDY